MKRLSLKSATFILALSMGTILLVLPSCRSHDVPRIAQMDTDRYENHILQRVDTVVVRDSVFVSERQRGDTVYLTRTEYRDRWRTQIVHDTIVRTDSIVQVIEHPPERYIPPFYKRCTSIFWTLMALLLLYVLIKYRL